MKFARVAAVTVVLLSGLALTSGAVPVEASTSNYGYSSGNPALPPADACGQTIRKADGTPWRCTFVDTFGGTQLNRSFWLPQTGTWYQGDYSAGYNCYIDSPQVISVSASALHLRVTKGLLPNYCGAAATPTNYVGGMVSTYRLFSQRYGRFQARIQTQATSSPGLHEAFWLWPDDRYIKVNWPSTGEIDPTETFSQYNNRSIAFLHYGPTEGPWVKGVNTAWDCVAQRGVWNVYTVSWSPKTLTVQVNGKTCLFNNTGATAFKERYIVNLTSALGEGKNAMTSGTPIPATMLVDYVKVWL